MRSRLADYQLLGPAGGGDSWIAVAPSRLGSAPPVIVTVLDAGVDDWPAVSARLSSLAGVHSAHLPRLLEAGQTDEDDGVVTWVARGDGRPLAEHGAATDPPATLRRLAAAARGAHDLHEAGWVHGRIGPDRLLDRGGDTLLEPPLGLPDAPWRATPPGADAVALDTLEPAGVWGEGPSRAADIWALGATAHRLLTGRLVHPALEGDLIVTAVQRVLIEPPAVDPGLPPAVAELLRSCLAPDPADRPGTAADLADRFEQLATGR